MQLSDADVLAVYRSTGTTKQIADRFGISRVTVSRIRNGTRRSDVTGHARPHKPTAVGIGDRTRKLTGIVVWQILIDPRPAVDIAEHFGVNKEHVWAIKSGRARHTVTGLEPPDYVLNKRGKPARKLQPCGTAAAYQRHRYHGQTPCQACQLAHNENRKLAARAKVKAKRNHLKGIVS